MARVALDFSKVNSNNFPVYPVGSYTLLIKECRQEASKASGNLKLSVQFEIVDGPNGSPEFAGKKLFASYSLLEKAAFRVKKLAIAAGMTPQELDTNGLDDELLTGRTIRADLAVEKYNGADQNRVQNEMPVAGVAPVGGVAPGSFAPAPSGFQAPTEGVTTTWGSPSTEMPAPPPAAKVD